MVNPQVARKAQVLGRVRPPAVADLAPVLLLLFVVLLSGYLFFTPFP